MATALLTGATGFVGSHLFDLLTARGWRVRCTLRRTSDTRWLAGRPYDPVEADLRDGAGLARAMEGADAVFHVAGVVSAPTLALYRAGNWLASKHMIEAAVAADVRRFVHVSSIAAAGPSRDGTPFDEDAPCAPISMYGKTKLEGEREAWRHRDRIGLTVVRPPVVYGPRDRGMLDLYRTLARGIEPRIGGAKRVSIVHVDDLVRGILAAAEHPRAGGEIFYLANPGGHEYGELARMILAALERRAARMPVPDRVVRLLGAVAGRVLPLLGRGGLFNYDKALEMTQPSWVCSPAKAKRLLGWEAAIPIERGLRETLAWYRRERWI